MRILLVDGVGHQERPDNQPWERSWEEASLPGIQYFDPAFAPTYERFDYDNLFSGRINLFTDEALRRIWASSRSELPSKTQLKPYPAVSSQARVIRLGTIRRRSGRRLACRHGSGVGSERRIARGTAQTIDRANRPVQSGRHHGAQSRERHLLRCRTRMRVTGVI